MATSNKDFKVKNGLIVEGATATVNGFDVLTTDSEINSAVPLGEDYPSDKNNGSLFYNTATNRFAIFHNSVWKELAYFSEIAAVFGGDSETTVFSSSQDGGDSSTTMFIGAIDGGSSSFNAPSENFLIA